MSNAIINLYNMDTMYDYLLVPYCSVHLQVNCIICACHFFNTVAQQGASTGTCGTTLEFSNTLLIAAMHAGINIVLGAPAPHRNRTRNYPYPALRHSTVSGGTIPRWAVVLGHD